MGCELGERRSLGQRLQFFAANIVDTDLPPADLLISKHVLQFLPIRVDLAKPTPGTKLELLVNGTSLVEETIPAGGWSATKSLDGIALGQVVTIELRLLP